MPVCCTQTAAPTYDLSTHSLTHMCFACHPPYRLIPITAEEWRDVEDKLLPGDEVKIRVHKLRQPGLYRWPIQLEILDPEIAPFITSPHDWSCPCNLGWAFDQGWDLQQVSPIGHLNIRSFMVEFRHNYCCIFRHSIKPDECQWLTVRQEGARTRAMHCFWLAATSAIYIPLEK